MSPALTERDIAERSDETSLLQKFLPPSFFTPQVVKNRTAAPAPKPKSPLQEPKQYSQPVKRRLTSFTTTYIMLHMDKNDRSFYFKCLQNSTKSAIGREELLAAIGAAHGGEWVRIKIGTEVFKLDRADLVAALHSLES